jgi:benzil reductase ((S)-benzoin forming)
LNYYYITGTSRGIGKSLAENLLENPSNQVIGISRNKSIEHPNYHHAHLDLTDATAVAAFQFELHAHAEKIYLINNAGTLGFIKPVGQLESTAIIQNYTVNLIAPTLLTNAFMKCYATTDAEKVIVNISSGAGKTPIDGWAVYCASKAGIDMFSRVVNAEQTVKATAPLENIHQPFHIFSIAPGVVNTAMQDAIRTTPTTDFSRVNDFINYKINNLLSEPDAVSKKYIHLLSNIKNIKEIIFSIKDYD